MLNKKGTTLIELIISIALVSVVLIFMIKLLVDINNTETNNTFAKQNQVKRAEIIRAIENDLVSKDISSITTDKTSPIITIYFTDESHSSIKLVNDKKLTYTYIPSTGTKDTETWTLTDGKFKTDGFKITCNEGANDTYSFNIDIEIHTENDLNKEGNNNILDDIEISYVGNKSDLNGGYKSFKTICDNEQE